MPSASVSNHSVASRGNASFSSKKPSLSSSESIQLGILSASASAGRLEASNGSESQVVSSASLKPSLSSSVSKQSGMPSESVSAGRLAANNGLLPHVISSASE